MADPGCCDSRSALLRCRLGSDLFGCCFRRRRRLRTKGRDRYSQSRASGAVGGAIAFVLPPVHVGRVPWRPGAREQRRRCGRPLLAYWDHAPRQPRADSWCSSASGPSSTVALATGPVLATRREHCRWVRALLLPGRMHGASTSAASGCDGERQSRRECRVGDDGAAC